MFYFYQDVALAHSDYFYYRSGCVKDRPDCMHVNRYFVHHKMLDTVPTYPVLVRSCTNRKWFVRMDDIENELYITTGWNRIKKEMSITDNHLVVFEMVDMNTFEMSVFRLSPVLRTPLDALCCHVMCHVISL